MRQYLLLLLVVTVVSAVRTTATKCNLNGALVKCSSQPDEVCGVSTKGGKQVRQTFVNSCQSCALGKVDFYLPHSCDQYPTEAVFCTPSQKKTEVCTEEYMQVCGWFGENIQCFAAPCASEASNTCYACSNENVVYYTHGACPKSIGI